MIGMDSDVTDGDSSPNIAEEKNDNQQLASFQKEKRKLKGLNDGGSIDCDDMLKEPEVECVMDDNGGIKQAKRNSRQGVSFSKLNSKWKARLSISGKEYHVGYFDDEEIAYEVLKAVKDDFKEIAEFLDQFGDDDGKAVAFAEYIREHIYKNRRMKSSKYRGVSFKHEKNKWTAFIRIDGHRFHIGFYDDEETANDYSFRTLENLSAIKELLSAQPDHLGKVISFAAYVKNHIDKNRHQKSSHHRGVAWDEAAQKWKCTIAIRGRSYFLGRYPPDEEAVAGWTCEWVRKHKAELEAIEDHKTRGSEIKLLLMLQQSFDS